MAAAAVTVTPIATKRKAHVEDTSVEPDTDVSRGAIGDSTVPPKGSSMDGLKKPRIVATNATTNHEEDHVEDEGDDVDEEDDEEDEEEDEEEEEEEQKDEYDESSSVNDENACTAEGCEIKRNMCPCGATPLDYCGLHVDPDVDDHCMACIEKSTKCNSCSKRFYKLDSESVSIACVKLKLPKQFRPKTPEGEKTNDARHTYNICSDCIEFQDPVRSE